MENLFDSLTSYGQSWEVVNSRKFNANEKNAISRNEIVSSDYGKSVCFFMKSGATKYIPLSNRSSLNIGDSVDVNSCDILTLSRDGKSCLRIQD